MNALVGEEAKANFASGLRPNDGADQNGGKLKGTRCRGQRGG